ncbi:MAG: class I SAM-dependent DNA methyltransferase [Dysgonomonas sp.]
MANERLTDFFIGRLLDSAQIQFTPNGSSIKEIQDALKKASKKGTGKAGFPEFTTMSGDFIIIIENKADITKQANYKDSNQSELVMDVKSITDYAENGALHYANFIIQNTAFKKIFAFGCSGDEKHHIIKPIYVDESGYKVLQPIENFENFSKDNIERYYREQVLEETPTEILELEEILKKSKELHEALRNYGQLGDHEKPLVVSAILLALSFKDFKVDDLTGNDIDTDGKKIYRALSNYMDKVGVSPISKKEIVLSKFNIIKERTILNSVNKYLEKTPLKYFTEYLEKYVLASVKENNAEDVLGRFYGEFMSFSGGDGQTLGVVLTPSHITELFCDLAEVKPTDRVFDPCCGTAGFLIAAMHKMIQQVDTTKEKNSIRKNQLFGIEVREDMFSIATTNMILRGDGKSNLENLDFLEQSVESLREKSLTVGFIFQVIG